MSGWNALTCSSASAVVWNRLIQLVLQLGQESGLQSFQFACHVPGSVSHCDADDSS
jgi:hypothetical protein